MRLVLAMVFAGFAALPFSVSAQSEAGPSEPNLQEPAPSSEPAPEQPALQLELDDDSVKLVPSPPPTVDGYTLEEMKLRVKRARIGLGVSALSTVVGIALSGAAGAQRLFCFEPEFLPRLGRSCFRHRSYFGGWWRRRNDCLRHSIWQAQAKAAQVAACALRDTTQSPLGPCPIATRVLTTLGR